MSKEKQKVGGAVPPAPVVASETKDITAVADAARAERIQQASLLEAEIEIQEANMLVEINKFLAEQPVFKFVPLEGVSDEYNRIVGTCLELETEDLNNRLKCLWRVGTTVKPWLARQVKAGQGTRQDLLERLAADLNRSSKRNINITGEKLRNACRLSCFTVDQLRRAVDCGLNEVQCISMTSKNVTDEIRDEIIKRVESGEIPKTEVSSATQEKIADIPPAERVENRGGLREQKEKKMDPIGLMTKVNNSLRKVVDELDIGQADAFVQMINAPEEYEDQVVKFQEALSTFGNLYHSLSNIAAEMKESASEGFGMKL